LLQAKNEIPSGKIAALFALSSRRGTRPTVNVIDFRGGITMASKKSAAKKTTAGKKDVKLRNLPNGKRTITAEQLQAVKGGGAYMKFDSK
jgi:hypothetical protein